MTEYILSYGAGVNSTALLLEWLRRGKRLEAVLFADPGSEMPETYEFIEEYAKPFCAGQGIPFETVRYYNKEKEVVPIYDAYIRNKAVPAIMQRSCTHKWKILPMQRFLKANYPQARQLVGIDYGELHRARFTDKELLYPLIDWEMTRDDCVTIIEAHGWPAPVKSGCFFCPFQDRADWKQLYEEHPDLYLEAERMEMNGRRFPKFNLMQTLPKRLDWFRKAMESQTTLDSFEDSEVGVREVHCGCYDG